MTDAELEELERVAQRVLGNTADSATSLRVAKGTFALISTIRELREENAALKRDRAPVTPEALAWGKEEAARIEAKEAARDRVVEAARLAKSQWEESALSDFWCFPEELSSALAALEEAKP